LRGREQRLDGFVSEYQERGDRPKTGGGCLVTPAVADATNDLFAAKFLQIIGGVARPVVDKVVGSHPPRSFRIALRRNTSASDGFGPDIRRPRDEVDQN
jgi:hypothetical protein